MPSESELMPQSSGGLFDLKSLMQLGLNEQHYQRQIERENALRSVGIMTSTLESLKSNPDRYNTYLNKVIKGNPTLTEAFNKVNLPLEQFELPPINQEAEIAQKTQQDIINTTAALNTQEKTLPQANALAIKKANAEADVVKNTAGARDILAVAKGEDAMRAEEAGLNSPAGKRLMDTKLEQALKQKKAEIAFKMQSNPGFGIDANGELSPVMPVKDSKGNTIASKGITEYDAQEKGFGFMDNTQGKPIFDAQQRLKGDYSALYSVVKQEPDKAQERLMQLLSSNVGPFANEGSAQSAIARLQTEYLMSTMTNPKKHEQAQNEYKLLNMILSDTPIVRKGKTLTIEEVINGTDGFPGLKNSYEGNPSPFYFSLILAGKNLSNKDTNKDFLNKLQEANKRTDANINQYKNSFSGNTML